MHKILFVTCRRYCAQAKLSSESLNKKIIYNCWLMQDDVRLKSYFEQKRLAGRAIRREYLQQGQREGDALCLKYLEDAPNECSQADEKAKEEPDIVHLPFSKTVSVISEELKEFEDAKEEAIWNPSSENIVRKLIKDKHWIPHDPQIASDGLYIDGEVVKTQYGTADEDVPISNIPCGGCGALLHCQVC